MSYKIAAGHVINDVYEVLGCLGEGGIGIVYKARQLDLNRIVAIKILREIFVDDEQWLARFQREGRILASLQHTNIVACYAAGLWQARVPFLVFEYLEGQSLRSLLRDVLDIKQSLDLSLQICEALRYAHACNVIHRDLKPENIMLVAKTGGTAGLVLALDTAIGDTEAEKKYSAKVVDFGLASLLETNESLTKSGMLLGSLCYMSPEQCQGQKADQRSDIYATACILYECLTGVPPHQADSPTELLYKQATLAPKKISELSKNSPAALDLLMVKALAKNPDDRYQSAAEMTQDLLKLKDSIEKKVELNLSQIVLTPALKKAVSAERNPFKIQTTAVLALLIAGAIASLLFVLADPGPARCLSWAAGLRSRRDRIVFLENMGDQMASQKRKKGAMILYAQAFNFSGKDKISTRARLLSKRSALALSSGDREEAAALATEYFSQIGNRNYKQLDLESFKRILSVIEIVPIAWSREMYYTIWQFAKSPWFIADADYPVFYNVQFALTIADSPEGDGQLRRLENLLLIIADADVYKDAPGRARIITWAQKHMDKFGFYKRLLVPILLEAQTAPTLPASSRKSIFQSVIDACIASGNLESPDRVCMLLATANAFSTLALNKEEAYSTEKLQPILISGKKAEAAVVCNLLMALESLSKGDCTSYFRLAHETIRILAQLDDKSDLIKHPFAPMRDWVFNTLQLPESCPLNTPGRFEYVKDLVNIIESSSRRRSVWFEFNPSSKKMLFKQKGEP